MQMQIQSANEQARRESGKETLPDLTFTLSSNNVTGDPFIFYVRDMSDLLLARWHEEESLRGHNQKATNLLGDTGLWDYKSSQYTVVEKGKQQYVIVLQQHMVWSARILGQLGSARNLIL